MNNTSGIITIIYNSVHTDMPATINTMPVRALNEILRSPSNWLNRYVNDSVKELLRGTPNDRSVDH